MSKPIGQKSWLLVWWYHLGGNIHQQWHQLIHSTLTTGITFKLNYKALLPSRLLDCILRLLYDRFYTILQTKTTNNQTKYTKCWHCFTALFAFRLNNNTGLRFHMFYLKCVLVNSVSNHKIGGLTLDFKLYYIWILKKHILLNANAFSVSELVCLITIFARKYKCMYLTQITKMFTSPH